jgi:hypothetical protein
MDKTRILILTAAIMIIAGCESMSSATRSFESLNKVLTPLVILQKGS